MSTAKSGVTGTLQQMLLNKSLSSMVKGIRSHKSENGGSRAAEQEYIGKCLTEIKSELKSNFPDVKAVAIQKLIYLQMIGYDISWAAFHIIELMSAAWFGHKRIGYLAASLSFNKDTDVILLTTHLFRKGFNSSQGGGPSSASVAVEGFQYETGAAISCLANIVTPGLAEDLLADVYTLMNSSRPYIRKKAVLVLLKIFFAWPKALRLSFDRLKEKLDDENQGVVSAAVYVICELASKNPKNYLSLAPQFFKILTTSSNNWVLIKVVKLLGSLVPLEPRLAKKLTEPLSDIIQTTPAKSLLYECVNTLLCGELRSKTVVRLCLEKLRNFIEDPDQNLKYLGLLGLHKLLQKQPRVVSEHKDLILDCLRDDDITIRMRALDLITSMVSLRNLGGIIAKLMAHLDASEGLGHYREHVLERILFICAQDNFAYIADFEWYVSILVDLTHLQGVSRENALKINHQLLDVVIRVPGVRSYTIKQMINILLANRLTSKPAQAIPLANSTSPGPLRADPSTQAGTRGHMSEVLHAVGFILGEYTEYLAEQDEDFYHDLLTHLAHDDVVNNLPSNVQNVFVQNMMKIFSSALLQPFDNANVKDILSTVQSVAPKRKEQADETETEGDETSDAAPKEALKTNGEEEPLADEEEEDFDANGLRRRKHPSLKRTFAQWHDFIARLLNILYAQLPLFTRAPSVEVQERAVAYLQFVRWLIVAGEFESKITNWKLTPGGAAPQIAKAETPSAAAAAALAAPKPLVPAVTAKLDLLSLDPLTVSNQATLSIFDTPPPAAAQPAAPTNADMLTSSSSTFSPGLKEKLRAISIQFGGLYAERLNPVHPKAQRKVALPKGLDLDAPINPGCEEATYEGVDADEVSSDEDDNPYSTKSKKKSSKPRGGLYDDDAQTSGGFGARQPKVRTSRSKASSSSRSEYSFDDDKKPATAEDREEARRRQEQRRQQQLNDPYYIKDSSSLLSNVASSASTTAGSTVDDIPVRRLEDDDLPNLKVIDKNRRHLDEGPKRPTKVFKVLKHADMPEGESDDDGGKKKKRSKDRKSSKKDARDSDSDSNALDMDLTAPLAADEVMPRVKSYAETQAEREEAQRKLEESNAKSGSRKKDRKKHDRERDRDRDRERDRDSKKDRKESKDSKKELKSSSSASAAPAAAPSLFDLFDPMGATAPPGAKSASSSSSSSRQSTSIFHQPAPSPSASTSASASTSSSDRQHTLFKDSCTKIRYSAQYLSGSNVQLTLEFTLAAGNSKSINALSKFALELKPSKYVKAYSGSAVKSNSDKGATITVRDLAAGSTVTEKVTLDFTGTPLDRAFTLDGRVSYTPAEKADKGKDRERVELDLPLSTFIAAKKVSASEMANLLTSSAKPPTALASTTLHLKKMRVSDALRHVASTLNVALVEAVNFTATYYGVMVHNQHSVAVLVKAKKGDESAVSVEIKTTNAEYSAALLAECKQAIK